jgi:hypothetical protein
MSEFIEWLESSGWGYTGMSLPVKEEEDIEAEIEKMLKNDHYKSWGLFCYPMTMKMKRASEISFFMWQCNRR